MSDPKCDRCGREEELIPRRWIQDIRVQFDRGQADDILDSVSGLVEIIEKFKPSHLQELERRKRQEELQRKQTEEHKKKQQQQQKQQQEQQPWQPHDQEDERKIASAPAPARRSRFVTLCRFFQQGRCRNGDQCHFSHEVHAETKSDEVYECGVCYERVGVNYKRCGLLPNCDHVFCIDCIRQWRKSTEENGAEAVRSCPVCRTVSHHVVPSMYFCTGAKKERIIAEYREKVSQIPCKYYSEKGCCPFKKKCFYMHLKEDGTDAKVGPDSSDSEDDDGDDTDGSGDFYEHYNDRVAFVGPGGQRVELFVEDMLHALHLQSADDIYYVSDSEADSDFDQACAHCGDHVFSSHAYNPGPARSPANRARGRGGNRGGRGSSRGNNRGGNRGRGRGGGGGGGRGAKRGGRRN